MAIETTQIISSTMILAGVLALLVSSLFAFTNKKLWVLENDSSDAIQQDSQVK
jgi:hypothetical protein